MARFDGEKYLDPTDLGEAINSDGMDMAPFIARDESCLIFSRQAEGTRKADLYISFRGADGNWSQAQDMGENINTPTNDLAAKVTPDDKYIFFLSQVEMWPRIHWVDASIIDSLCMNTIPSETHY